MDTSSKSARVIPKREKIKRELIPKIDKGYPIKPVPFSAAIANLLLTAPPPPGSVLFLGGAYFLTPSQAKNKGASKQ